MCSHSHSVSSLDGAMNKLSVVEKKRNEEAEEVEGETE